MPKKTVRVALWVYSNKQKKRRTAFYGDEVDLSAAEIKRGEAAGVFDEPETPVVVQPVAPVSGPDQTTAAAVKGPAAATDGGDDLAGLGGDDDTPASDGADQSGDGDAPAPLAKPLNTALDQDWVAYAVSKGFDKAEAEKMVTDDRPGLIKALA